jgi:hypothetical protein
LSDRAGRSASDGEFRLGRVLSQSFRLFFTRFHRYALVAIGLSLPQLAANLYLQPMMRGLGGAGVVEPRQLARDFGLIGTSALIALVVHGLCQTVLIEGAWHEMRRHNIGLGTMLKRGLVRWPIAVVLLLLLYVLITIGAVFFVFPGIVFMTMAFVALPASVIERMGPFRSLTRSIDLTEGYRWGIFGIFLLILVPVLAGSVALQYLLMPRVDLAVSLVIGFIWQAIATAFGAILSVSAYLALRVAKEGGEIDRMAGVFD